MSVGPFRRDFGDEMMACVFALTPVLAPGQHLVTAKWLLQVGSDAEELLRKPGGIQCQAWLC